MDNSSARAECQPPAPPSVQILVQYLCDIMQMLRAWYEHFEESIRAVDHAAAVKAHDLMIEGVIAARQIARALNFELPTPLLDWTLTPRPSRPPTGL
ncbi:hypothetical protein SOM61_08405 [Massilia sp. CFBP9012]|uniref:hypothetical protein n=1 Tax=Massilia sp. CFBP9012 TaxID=3096531 RepID=UPI002A6B25A5|nr:hypothetical protein [Massilia sp. CFBP9012]MDY0974981.1 hypothetical protein [Massilia sp. CFBP9012]